MPMLTTMSCGNDDAAHTPVPQGDLYRRRNAGAVHRPRTDAVDYILLASASGPRPPRSTKYSSGPADTNTAVRIKNGMR